MDKHSILGLAQSILNYQPLLMAPKSSNLLGEQYEFRSTNDDYLRMLVKADGKIVVSLNGQGIGDRSLERAPAPDGSYLINVKFRTTAPADTPDLTVEQGYAAQLQQCYDKGTEGTFHVYKGMDDLVTVVFCRTTADEDTKYLHWYMTKHKCGAFRAAMHQLAEELVETCEADATVCQEIAGLLRDGRAEIIDPDKVLNEVAESHPDANKLKPYRVSLMENEGAHQTLFFDCEAEDADHAEDQAENAYPGCIVRNVTHFDHTDQNRVIFCELEDVDGDASSAFWSNADGWTDLSGATRFTEWESQTTNLPMGSGQVQWVRLDQAQRYSDARGLVKTALGHDIKLAEKAEGALAFVIEANSTNVFDPTMSECGRFEVDPAKTYGLSPELARQIKLLNDTLDKAVDDALNAGCLAIQEALGVTDGGFAGIFFSDDDNVNRLREPLARYMAAQIGHLGDGTVPVAKPVENTKHLGSWVVTHDSTNPRYLYVSRPDKPGSMTIKAEDEGYVVDLLTADDMPEVASTTYAHYEELKADKPDDQTPTGG